MLPKDNESNNDFAYNQILNTNTHSDINIESNILPSSFYNKTILLSFDLEWKNKESDMDLLFVCNNNILYYDKSDAFFGRHSKAKLGGRETIDLYKIDSQGTMIVLHSNGPKPEELYLIFRNSQNQMIKKIPIVGFYNSAQYRKKYFAIQFALEDIIKMNKN